MTSSSTENSPPAATRTPPPPRLRREQRKALHPLTDESDDGYSPHPSIYEASPVASDDDEGHSDKELSDSYDSAKHISAELLDTQQSGTPEPPGRSRNFSRFSGLSMMETITEQKSIKSTGDELLDGGAYTPLQQDDESEEGGDEQYYYDYASPTQPLHPAMSASAPNLSGELRTSIYLPAFHPIYACLTTNLKRVAVLFFIRTPYISSCSQHLLLTWPTTTTSPLTSPACLPSSIINEQILRNPFFTPISPRPDAHYCS